MKKKTKKKIVKKSKKPKKKGILEIKIDQILYNTRHVYLTGVIDEKNTKNIIKELRALGEINSKPIIMHINSRGGYAQEGLAIIDTMRTIKAPVITVITGIAASMAGIISITGVERIMTKNAVWMAHNMASCTCDYFEKIKDKVEYLYQLEKQIFKIFRTRTKLTERELTKSRNGELWIFADDAKKKGIADIVI